MKIKYYEMWNHSTSSINVPEEYKYPFGKAFRSSSSSPIMTSLEILESVLHGEENEKEFLAVDDYITGKSGIIPKCLLPDITATQKIAKEIVNKRHNARNNSNIGNQRLLLGLPILNVGYPKCGSTTLKDFFLCIGLHTNHGHEGFKMLEKAKAGTTILYERSAGEESYVQVPIQAYMQLDSNFGRGAYPQIMLLDEMHEEKPDSTFILNFRPLKDWMYSSSNWAGLKSRFYLFEVPGLKSQNLDYANCEQANKEYREKTTLPSSRRRMTTTYLNTITTYDNTTTIAPPTSRKLKSYCKYQNSTGAVLVLAIRL